MKQCTCDEGYAGFYCMWTDLEYLRLTHWVTGVHELVVDLMTTKKAMFKLIPVVSDTTILLDGLNPLVRMNILAFMKMLVAKDAANGDNGA